MSVDVERSLYRGLMYIRANEHWCVQLNSASPALQCVSFCIEKTTVELNESLNTRCATVVYL